MDKLSERQQPLVHQLHPGGGETVTPGAVDKAQHEGIRGLGVLRIVAFIAALALSVATAYLHFPWPFALAAWVFFVALLLGKRAERRPPGGRARA
ncbi:MAG TPA: hypothetical protein VFS43_03565 [Polyangiaceae bacterium]|nr:hypothetical protein [Polyangiaceae bacterium]